MNEISQAPAREGIGGTSLRDVSANRPTYVALAANLLWAGIAISLLNIVIVLFRVSGGRITVPLLVGALIAYGVVAALTGWIAIKILAGRNWARYVLLIVDLISVPNLVRKIGPTFDQSWIEGTLLASVYAVDYLAAILLFVTASNLWFKNQKSAPAKVA